MIISRTPFRISFFGGGTDYPVWYEQHGGAVLSTTIDKYCYLTCRYLPPFFDYKHRIVYSKVELIKQVKQIQHPVVRTLLDYMKVDRGIELHHDGDLPARTGLGSSSSFTVGLLHSLYALKGIMPTEERLAREAMMVERDMLREAVGSQDQVAAAYGGFNRIVFNRDGSFSVDPVIMPPARLENLQKHVLLYFTGFSRTASLIAKKQIQSTKKRTTELRTLYGMVDEAVRILTTKAPITEFGDLLHEAWQIKRSLTNKISTPEIDQIYEQARRAGASGGKLLGAGGGGFMILFVKPAFQAQVRRRLRHLLEVKFRFESAGSHIVFYRDGY